jgi:hypothetical protein
MALFGIKKGLKIFGSEAEADVLNGTSDPSTASGIAAPQGSLYLKADGVSYKKTGAADTAWQPYSVIEGGGLLWSTISGATTLEASQGYILDASAAVFTITMPAAPEEGDSVGFAGLGDIETNNVTVDLNSLNMNGSDDDLVIDLNYCYFEMLYTGDATTGWVLSNTDESGNVDNIQAFVGNDDNADPAVTEFTGENYIAAGDSLEDAIDKLDIALDTTSSGLDVDLTTLSGRVDTNETNISTNSSDITTNYNSIVSNDGDITTNASGIAGNDQDISDLEAYTGSAGASSPDYNQENYIADDDSLEEAISKLDAALKVVDNLSATGVNWQQAITAATSDAVLTGAAAYSGTDHFSDDDTPFWTHADWADGAKVLSTNATTSGIIYAWSDSADQWVQDSVLGANDAVAVQYDFLDSPGSQEDGAAYMMNSDNTEVIKIADFDLETAASIAISSGYTASSGTITSDDSVESAIEKLDFNLDAATTAAGALESRVTTNESNISTNTNNISSNDTDIATNASGISVNASDIDDLEAAVGSATGLTGMDYTSTEYVTVDSSVLDAISALDLALDTLDTTTTSGISRLDTNITNVDTAHDNLANAVLKEATTSVAGSATDTVVDTVAQAGNLGAKWFVIAYDGSANRYACEIYAMHDGTTSADLTEYAILTIGTKLKLDFDVAANGTSMSLTVDNADASAVTIKTQRISVQTTSVVTTAVLS